MKLSFSPIAIYHYLQEEKEFLLQAINTFYIMIYCFILSRYLTNSQETSTHTYNNFLPSLLFYLNVFVKNLHFIFILVYEFQIESLQKTCYIFIYGSTNRHSYRYFNHLLFIFHTLSNEIQLERFPIIIEKVLFLIHVFDSFNVFFLKFQKRNNMGFNNFIYFTHQSLCFNNFQQLIITKLLYLSLAYFFWCF